MRLLKLKLLGYKLSFYYILCIVIGELPCDSNFCFLATEGEWLSDFSKGFSLTISMKQAPPGWVEQATVNYLAIYS